MAHDGKKVLYFVKKCSEAAQVIKAQKDTLVDLKTEWTSKSPDVAAEPVIITVQQAIDFNAFKNAIVTVLSDHATIIDAFKVIEDQHPSHNPISMADWD